jgi:pimeloyl-ACP methyl ester carboxylesterase
MSIFTTEGFKARQAILSDKLVALDCRVAVLRGEKSMLFPESAGKYMHELTNKKMPIIAIPEAHHHIMVDQPLALVAALRALVTDWDHSVPAKAE